MEEQSSRLESSLVARYEAIDNDMGREAVAERDGLFEPECAPVPFIGKKYGEQGRRKLLIYGSAENLTYLHPERAREPLRRLRHRLAEAPLSPFRNVHIEPINNGGLLTVGRYLVQLLADQGFADCEFSRTPREFLDEIAVANFGKFSLLPTGSQNQDYAGSGPLLSWSAKYVAADLEVLAPDIVILPHTIFIALGKARQRQLFAEYPDLIIVGCPQFADLNRARLRELAEGHEPAWETWLEDGWIAPCEKSDLLRDYLRWMTSWTGLPAKGYKRLTPDESGSCAFWSSKRDWSLEVS